MGVPHWLVASPHCRDCAAQSCGEQQTPNLSSGCRRAQRPLLQLLWTWQDAPSFLPPARAEPDVIVSTIAAMATRIDFFIRNPFLFWQAADGYPPQSALMPNRIPTHKALGPGKSAALQKSRKTQDAQNKRPAPRRMRGLSAAGAGALCVGPSRCMGGQSPRDIVDESVACCPGHCRWTSGARRSSRHAFQRPETIAGGSTISNARASFSFTIASPSRDAADRA